MLNLKIDFKAFVFIGSENKIILNERLKKINNYEYFKPSENVKIFLEKVIDNEKYTIYYNDKETDMKVMDDGGVFGIATICQLAHQEGRKIMISGQGGDEILSDYSLLPKQSELKGRFPDKLYKWRNFDRGCNESYLLKEEFSAGAFSIESRYPFLDTRLVQEFLYLSPKLKNSSYKAPLREYLLRNNFPFDENKKIGFSVYL